MRCKLDQDLKVKISMGGLQPSQVWGGLSYFGKGWTDHVAQRGQSSFFLESFSHKLQNFVVIERQVAYISKVQHIFPSQTMHPFSCLPCRRAGGTLAERLGISTVDKWNLHPPVLETRGLLRWNLLIKRVGWDAKLRVSTGFWFWMLWMNLSVSF